MNVSSKLDLSASPDRPPYPSGLRGLSAGTSLDRSGSFHESMENPILSSLPSMSRSSFRVTQEDILSFFQFLHLDPKCVGFENKFQRLAELKRVVNVAFGISQDDSSSGSLKGRLLSSFSHEDLKKTKAALRESSNVARERSRIFGEALSAFKKFFPSIPLRKRSRMDVTSSGRANAVPLNDQSGLGPRIMKMGTSGHAVANAPGVELQKSEERTKNTKRTRTSLLDARANSLARQCTLMDKERGAVQDANSGALLTNDHTHPIESWERSKMKKKRSGIKLDVSPSTSSAKPVDGQRELKQGMHQRLTMESVGFRSGIGNGAAGIRKLGGRLQQTDSSPRSCIARVDHDNGARFGDNKERPSDKERVNLKTVNKTSMREEYNSPSPNSNAKLIASARAPLSNTGTLPKLSASSQQTTSSDWEITLSTNKPFVASGTTSRKRTPSARSSSPPVAHWAGPRPQKISRIARRTSFLPVVSNSDEAPSFNAISDVGSDNGFMFEKSFPSISTQQVKSKIEQLSDSEESGVGETKKKKKKMLNKADGRAGHNVKKASAVVLPSQKNKLIGGEEFGDGVRRKGRTSRSLTSSRSLMPMTVEKLGVGTEKQPRTTRMGLDKANSKTDRPSMRKLSDRKAYLRNRLCAVHAAADLGDDVQQELLAAANAVIDPSHLSLFWRHMELIYRFISEADIDFLKQQDEIMSVSDTPKVPTSTDANSAANCLNGFAFVENLADAGLIHPPEQLISEATVHDTIPLCQRLIAALITDEDDYGNARIEEMQLDSYEPGFQLNAELESGAMSHGLVRNSYPAMSTAPNGCSGTVSGVSLDELEDKLDHESHMVSSQNLGAISSTGYLFDRLLQGSEMIAIRESAECQYLNMSISERALLEIQSIGIYPEQPEMREMDNEEVSQQIRHLDEEYHQQVAKKRCFILKLLKSASQSRELQEKDFEQCALEKLVTMAYEKYMASFGGKGATSKMMKQAALAFVNRTLEHCQRYEASGKSCFHEPLFRDIFNTMLNKLTESQSVDSITESESGRGYPNRPLVLQQIDQHVQTRELSSSSVLLHESSSDQNISKQDARSNKVKKRELLDVSANSPPVTGGPLMSSTKGKRTERDRDGKGQAGNTLSENGTTKLAQPAVGSTNGDRKSKAKAKQKTAQLSASVDGLLGKISEQPNAPFSSLPSENMTENTVKEKEDFSIRGMDNPVGDLSRLEVPEIDVDLGGQGQDLASWLNIDDDSLQDHDFMGLQIPMDDLSDVNMMI